MPQPNRSLGNSRAVYLLLPDVPALIATKAVVRGRVQGVGFRMAAAYRARGLALSGWVRNLPNGSVETVAQGSHQAVDAYLAWLDQGPRGSAVIGVEKAPIAVDLSMSRFEVR